MAAIEVDVVDAAGARELVGLADEVRRSGDALRTVAVGQVERTNGWKGQGAKSISEWLSIETDCAHYEAQSVVMLAGQLQHLPVTQAALAPFEDSIFKQARKSGVHERPEAYAADALMALCTAKNVSTTKTTRSNAVMNIRIDYNALKSGHTEHGEICEIAGVGPIPVATATEYLGEAFLKLLVVDGVDIKTVAHMGRAIPAPLRTAVEERDRVCQVPTCDMTIGLEIDHIKPFSEGGPASLENLVRLCKRHHLQKTHDGYRLEKTEESPLNGSKGTH